MIKRYILLLLLINSFSVITYGQSFRVEDIKDMFGKGKPFKLSGGFSANSVINAGNAAQARDPFTYYLNGNINLNIYGLVNLPFAFSLTNSGSSYKLPSSPNRLSIHPSYKWITGHIGDVSMSFSPYTLNGHMFTGAGVELNPDGWEFAAMYGRLQKAVEYDDARPAFLPTYKRMGYGVKAGKTGDKYKVSLNMFTAKDQASSLTLPPDSFGVNPMENLSGSLSFLIKPVRYIELSGEYGFSLLTMDVRAPEEDRDGIQGVWNGNNMSSAYYNALKAQLNYVSESSRIGVGYERIDPGYQTLGAYYFTNDIENITINAYQSLWQNKVSIDLSIGYEHDDLAKKKASASSRVVGSATVTASINERINANVSYTNFQTHTNVRSNFELINQEITLDNLDTLNFVQLSQSANMNLNLITKLSESQSHTMNLNVSYQDAANKQGGIYHPGSVTEMINGAAAYSISFLKKGLTVNGALNINNSKLYNGNTFTWGPTIGASLRFLKKKATAASSVSYNTGKLAGVKQNEVFMVRLNTSYTPFQRHSFTLAYNFLWRTAINRPDTNNSLITAGYSYGF